MGNAVSNAPTSSPVDTTTPSSVDTTTCSKPTSTITKGLTEHPPSGYSLKIENLTQLNYGKYESRRFTVCGHDWRLIIYPKGNKEDNGSGFVSMYAELIDSTSEVFAYVKFFLYNKKEQKYFTIQDTEVKRFNALRMVWGFSQMLPLSLFNDPSNGYILGGHKCEFGVDVMVMAAPSLTNWEVVSFNEQLSDDNFIWRLKGFSRLKKKKYTSKTFSVGGRQWVLLLHPKGYSKPYGNWLSIYMAIADSGTLIGNEKIYVLADLQVLDPLGSDHDTLTIKEWFDDADPGKGWGLEQFVSIAKLRDAYLDKDDTLTVEIKFKVVSATKYSLP